MNPITVWSCANYQEPGGGGYLYMIAKDPEAAACIKQILHDNRPNENARFVDMDLSTKGLQVSVKIDGDMEFRTKVNIENQFRNHAVSKRFSSWVRVSTDNIGRRFGKRTVQTWSIPTVSCIIRKYTTTGAGDIWFRR